MIFLVLGFLIKHWIADWVIRPDFLSQGKYDDKYWFLPLFIHSAIHGVFTYLIVTLYTINPGIGALYGAIDLLAHFTIDRLKVVEMKKCMRDEQDLIVLDQLLHMFTYALMIWSLI